MRVSERCGTGPGPTPAATREELVGRPVGELAALVRSGEVSATEVIREHLNHIEKTNPQVNAFVHVAHDEALAAARRVDEARRQGEPLGPLAGVPFSVKDVIAVQGLPLEAGSPALRGHISEQDATAVRWLRDAGAICVGKTNTPEFALWPLTWNEVHGHTRNPATADHSRSPGGSSGGEAAAVASGMSAFGLGSDFGGSLRWPAHCTGLVSLRPTVGRVPADGQVPGLCVAGRWLQNPRTVQGRLQVIGPMTRTVSDLRLVVRMLAGPSPWEDHAGLPWSDERIDLAQLRVAWSDGEGTVPVSSDIRRAVAQAAARLEGEVASLEELRPAALTEAAALFGEIRATDQHEEIRRIGTWDQFGQTIRQLLDATVEVPSERVSELWARRAVLRARMLAEMPDVLLLPVASIAAPRLEDHEFILEGRKLGVWEILAPCRAISLFGFPSAVVPIGRMPDGRPLGVQIVARPYADEAAVAVAEALERLCADRDAVS